MESTSEKKRRYPTMESNAIARKAKREIRLEGHTEIVCPYCKTSPVITMTSRWERTITSCECGYLADVEINL